MGIEDALKIDGWMFESELEQLAKWAKEHTNIVEVGSWKGRSTRALCDNTNGHVFAVDHWKGPEDLQTWKNEYNEIISHGSKFVYNQFRSNMAEHIASGKLFIIKKSSLMGAKYLLTSFGEYFDMVFIDSDHDYKNIYKDIEAYKEILIPNGLLCGHDYNWNGVKKAVNELLPGFKTNGNLWYKEV
jgi:hypothetical protein